MQQQHLPLLCNHTGPTCSTKSILVQQAAIQPPRLVNMASSYQPSRLVSMEGYRTVRYQVQYLYLAAGG
jgi:hypothetical protein